MKWKDIASYLGILLGCRLTDWLFGTQWTDTTEITSCVFAMGATIITAVRETKEK